MSESTSPRRSGVARLDPQTRANIALTEATCMAAASMIRRTLDHVEGAAGVNHWRLQLQRALDALEGR